MDEGTSEMAEPDEDELCPACSNIDLHSLFTGPRYFPHDHVGRKGGTSIHAGTLREVLDNIQCPLCRLIRHDLYGSLPHDSSSSLWYDLPSGLEAPQPNPSRVRCCLDPMRADYFEETRYTAQATRDQVATMVTVRLAGVDGCSTREADHIRRHYCGNGLRLLSPDSVDPNRPLLNGYRAATTLTQSLAQLSGWIKTCCHSHQDTCELPDLTPQNRRGCLRLINVALRTLVSRDPETCAYAALSYVWGQKTEEYVRFADEIQLGDDGVAVLPPSAPGIIEDGIEVCKRLEIPFLWVDLYCVDQHDPVQKAADIRDMGLIYQQALITFIAGGSGSRLLHCATDSNIRVGPRQLVETIRGRKYITASTSIASLLRDSAWNERGWTYQEGALARRIAFFGEDDVSFLCSAGHWRGCLHSGRYGHSANLADLDLSSTSYYTLSANQWLRDAEWRFGDFDTMLRVFSPRLLSYESDKLNAIAGCLNLLARRKSVLFVHGLPLVDFHYALLWGGEDDRRRPGFPSWSWAAWCALQQEYIVTPDTGSSGELRDDGMGQLRPAKPPTAEISLQGLLINCGIENPTPTNTCSQNVALVAVRSEVLTVTSEMAHFSFAILPSATDPADVARLDAVPPSFDSRKAQTVAPYWPWDHDREYHTPFERIRLIDSSGNACQYHYPRWYDHWPYVKLNFPRTLCGSTLAWLLRDGINLVKIVDVNLLRGEDGLRKYHHVLCLGIDRSGEGPGRGRRLGMFCMSGEMWARALPREETVELV